MNQLVPWVSLSGYFAAHMTGLFSLDLHKTLLRRGLEHPYVLSCDRFSLC